jgi:hypothetical protein
MKRFVGYIGKLGSNIPWLSAFDTMEIVGLKWLSWRNLSAGGGQVSFVNRARPTKNISHLTAGFFLINYMRAKQEPINSNGDAMRTVRIPRAM